MFLSRNLLLCLPRGAHMISYPIANDPARALSEIGACTGRGSCSSSGNGSGKDKNMICASSSICTSINVSEPSTIFQSVISLFASVGYEKRHGSDLRTSLGCTGDVIILLITVPTKSMIRVIVYG